MVVGPTASGKSDLSLNLAEKTQGVILNADSIQMYQGLVIGAAAPTKEDQARCPHFLFGEVAPPQEITAGEYAARAHQVLAELAQKNTKVVYVVGGTGFYLQALEKGMMPVGKADPTHQARLEAELSVPLGAEKLHAELMQKDPITAGRISVNDHYRLVRALEIIRRTGRSFTEIQNEHKASEKCFPFPLLKLGVRGEKDTLNPRIQKRAEKMVMGGIINEVRNLLEAGFKTWAPLQSVGYRETISYLDGDAGIDSKERLIEAIALSTRQLAKKQRTWFARDPEIKWMQLESLNQNQEQDLVFQFLER